MESFEILKIQDSSFSRIAEHVSEEIPLTVEINGNELATLLCSPDNLRNLVVGFLFTSGVISDISSIQSLTVDVERFHTAVSIAGEGGDFVFKRVYTSGCGKGVIFHNPLDVMNRAPLNEEFFLRASDIAVLMRDFIKGSSEHSRTKGVHSAALASRDRIHIFRDDIGRHNAMDKVVGEALSRGMDFSDKVMLTTGRISSEILSKVLRCRIPVIAALGSPTNQAVKLARATNLTLVSHVRGTRMSVYSGDARLQMPGEDETHA